MWELERERANEGARISVSDQETVVALLLLRFFRSHRMTQQRDTLRMQATCGVLSHMCTRYRALCIAMNMGEREGGAVHRSVHWQEWRTRPFIAHDAANTLNGPYLILNGGGSRMRMNASHPNVQ